MLRRDDVSSDRFATYDPKQGGASTRASLVLDLAHAHKSEELDAGSWSLAPFLIFRSLRLRQNFTGFLARPIDGDSSQQLNEALTLGAHALYRKSLRVFSPSDLVEMGLYLRNDFIEQSQRALGAVDDRVFSADVDARIRATSAAAFVDVSLKPIKRLTVRSGLRIDGLAYSTIEQNGQARSALGTHIGPRVTVDVRAIGALHVVASYGEGFRSPQARSLGEGERTPKEDGAYGTGAAANVNNLREFVTALSRTLGHFRGEGECFASEPPR